MFAFRKTVFVKSVCAIFFCVASCRCGSIGKSDENSEGFQAAVQYYEDLIDSELEKALKYEPPTNAKMYEPSDNTIEDFGTFDFIVIGAGSTGSVIASRLSEISKWKVLLLEAGKYPNNFTMIPGFFAIQAMTEYNWGFVSTPQKTACLGAQDKRCVVHRGKGMGGTSLINQLIYSRGNPVDYNRWADLLGDPNWKYESVLRFLKKSEDFHKTNPDAPVDLEFHGQGGELYTNFQTPPSSVSKIFLEANKDLGQNITDYNGKEQLGATILQLNTKGGRRLDQASAFIKPARMRHNLVISDESYVIKIEIDNQTKETIGVLFTKNKKTYRAKVDLEVILSAGAISSPHILMLSGIGRKHHLKLKNVTLIQNLEVGSGLQDHVFCPIPFSSNLSLPQQSLNEKIRDFLDGSGVFTAGNPLDAAGWYKTNLEEESNHHPDIEIIPTFNRASTLGRRFLRWSDETWADLKAVKTFGMSVVLLKTKSKGTIRLASNNPYIYPIINSNSLSDINDKDINTLLEGIKIAMKIIKTPTYRKFNATINITPLKACNSEDMLSEKFWHCYMRQLSTPAFHPVGTCTSGKDPKEGAVVDSNLKVFGIKKLRVADASVIPFTFAGHPNAICTMIAEKLSHDIKTENKIYA